MQLLTDLPIDCIEIIIRKLSLSDYYHMCLTSKQINQLIKQILNDRKNSNKPLISKKCKYFNNSNKYDKEKIDNIASIIDIALFRYTIENLDLYIVKKSQIFNFIF